MELLEAFRRDAQAGFALLGEEPDAASPSSFITLVHALKSALANIGANDLSQTAALLEKAARQADTSVLRGNLASFREQLAALTKRIAEVVEPAPTGNDETQIHPETRELLARLRESLGARDIEATDTALARLQSLPLTGQLRGAVAGIADCILTMDFRQAADAVTLLLKRR
jgi:HPt (histidine-containing phosphotransfer) domain-containing protein